MNEITTLEDFKYYYGNSKRITIRHIIEAAFYCFAENEVLDEELVIEVLHNYHLRKWGLG